MLRNRINDEFRPLHPPVSSHKASKSTTQKDYPGVQCVMSYGDVRSRRRKEVPEARRVLSVCGQIRENLQNEGSKSECEEEKTNTVDSVKASSSRASKGIDFSEPKLLTSLKIIESFNNLLDKDKPKKTQSLHGVSNSAKQATRKTNIPFEEKVYKGLIDLRVNDEELGLDLNIPLKPKEIIKTKEPEPVLSDYYTPNFNKEYVIKPHVPSYEVTKFKMPEVPSVLQVTKRWEPEDFY